MGKTKIKNLVPIKNKFESREGGVAEVLKAFLLEHLGISNESTGGWYTKVGEIDFELYKKREAGYTSLYEPTVYNYIKISTRGADRTLFQLVKIERVNDQGMLDLDELKAKYAKMQAAAEEAKVIEKQRDEVTRSRAQTRFDIISEAGFPIKKEKHYQDPVGASVSMQDEDTVKVSFYHLKPEQAKKILMLFRELNPDSAKYFEE